MFRVSTISLWLQCIWGKYADEPYRRRRRRKNRWQDEVIEDGRTVGGEEWQEKVYTREEGKKLLRTAWNRHILHTPME
jgi:hypothetical protein